MGAFADFRQFMTGVAGLEDLQKVGSHNLLKYQENLELFRKEPISSASKTITGVATAAPSARLTKYLKDGGWHEEQARLVATKLDSALKALLRHVFEAQAILTELENLVEKANTILLSEFCPSVQSVEDLPFEAEDEMEDVRAQHEPMEIQPRSSRLQRSDYAHIMALILTMLVDDFDMQERAVRALGLDTPSEALQSYTLMWTLRPFVDDSVIEQALSWIEAEEVSTPELH